MRLIDADKIQEEIKKCDGFACDDYGRGICEGIRRALMEISETETVNIEEIRADERAKVLKEIKERSICFQGEETYGKKTKILLFTEEAYHVVFG